MFKLGLTSKSLSFEAKLAQKAAKGDGRAFDKLADLYWEDIYRLVYYRTNQAMDAEDIAQDAFCKAYERLGSLQDPERFKPWLYSIALNLVKDHYRKKGVRSVVSPLGEAEGNLPEEGENRESRGEQRVFEKQFWQKVQDFLETMPPGEREAFSLRFLDQMSIPEVAQALDKSQSAVKTQLYRAIARFKDNSELLMALRGEA